MSCPVHRPLVVLQIAELLLAEMSDDKNCYGGSEPPKCPPKRPIVEKPLVLHCEVPPTATFTCPASDCAPPLPKEECAPPPPNEEECAPPPPPKEEECAGPAPEPIKVDTCAGAGPYSGAAAASAANSACGGQADNSCEVAPLSMTREDGSSRCGKNC